MAKRYTLPYKDNANIAWRVDIFDSEYTGPASTLRGVSQQAAVLSWSPEDTDDPYSVFIKSQLTISVQDGQNMNVRAIQQATDKQYVAALFRGDLLKWIGYIDPDGVQQPYNGVSYSVTLVAKDGLGMLADMDYVHAPLLGVTGNTSTCPMNYIRQVLFADKNLGLPLAVKWVNNLECTAYPEQDVFTGSVAWSPYGEGYVDGDGKPRSCEYVLKGILSAFGCRLFQSDGKWVIKRISDNVRGYYRYKQIPGNLDKLVIQTATESNLYQIGRSGDRFINEDGYITNRPGLRSCKVIYEADIRENILPNGNFDLKEQAVVAGAYVDRPLYWGTLVNPNLGVELVPSLDGRTGNGVKLSYNATMGIEPVYGITSPLPIDAYQMVKRIDISFLFSAISWVLDGNGFLNFTNMPLLFRVKYTLGSTIYYLNEFGFWTTTYREVPIKIDNISLNEVASVKFDAFQGVILPQPSATLPPGDKCELEVAFVMARPTLGVSQIFVIDNIAVGVDNNNDVYESISGIEKNTMKDSRSLNISSSFSGYMVSNLMTKYSRSDEEFWFKDSDLYTGSLTGLLANSIMRFRYKPSAIFNGSSYIGKREWTFDSIYTIDGFGTTKFLPLAASYNTEACTVNGMINMECRNDNVIFTEKFYGSNDKILSN